MLRIEDLRFSSSSIDEFFSPPVRLASSGRVRISSASQLAGFGRVAGADDQLVHLSQQDFWKLGQDSDGYFIERLVNDDNGPVVG
jgi:hypothetical protein